MLLEIRGLNVRYGGITAVSGISLSVKNGSIVSIVGANGAGKSTIMNTIAGLVRPSAGSITFKGTDITGCKPHDIVKMGCVMVPEGRGIFGNLTVLENLEVAASIHGEPIKMIHRRFEPVFSYFPRLKERLHQHAGTLSGGEQQMLAVGRALVTGGDILLLDEPSMGLAPALVDTIFSILLQISKNGTTLLLVEQNAYKALSISEYTYVLETGSVLLEGPSAEIRDDPRVKEAYLGG